MIHISVHNVNVNVNVNLNGNQQNLLIALLEKVWSINADAGIYTICLTCPEGIHIYRP